MRLVRTTWRHIGGTMEVVFALLGLFPIVWVLAVTAWALLGGR